jgi:hypothetical protein
MNIENIKTIIICILPMLWLWIGFWLFTFININNWIRTPFVISCLFIFGGLFIIAMNRFISILGNND